MDNSYINKVLNGDVNAFKYFVSNYKNFAYSLSFSILKNNYLSEESVQEAFIKTFEKLNTFKQKSSFKTWFGRIVINEALKRTKSKHDVYTSSIEISELEIESLECSLKNLLDQERSLFITEVFNELNHEESLVLELFYLKEFGIKDIVKMTGWSSSKVKMLNLRGRKNFYVKLKQVLKSEIKKVL